AAPPAAGPGCSDRHPRAPTSRAGGRTRARRSPGRAAARSAFARSGPPPHAPRSRPPIPAASWCSYFDHDGEDHRAAAGAVVDELAETVVDVLLDQLDLADVVLEQLADDVVRLLTQLAQQLVV